MIIVFWISLLLMAVTPSPSEGVGASIPQTFEAVSIV